MIVSFIETSSNKMICHGFQLNSFHFSLLCYLQIETDQNFKILTLYSNQRNFATICGLRSSVLAINIHLSASFFQFLFSFYFVSSFPFRFQTRCIKRFIGKSWLFVYLQIFLLPLFAIFIFFL